MTETESITIALLKGYKYDTELIPGKCKTGDGIVSHYIRHDCEQWLIEKQITIHWKMSVECMYQNPYEAFYLYSSIELIAGKRRIDINTPRIRKELSKRLDLWKDHAPLIYIGEKDYSEVNDMKFDAGSVIRSRNMLEFKDSFLLRYEEHKNT